LHFLVTITRVNVAPGIAMPFYPARPITGVALRTPDQAQLQFERDMDLGRTCQPKMNGDRAALGVTPSAIHIQNRHGGWISQNVRNRAVYQELQAGTVLDGEVIDGHFYPFECIAVDGVSLVSAPTSERVRTAKALCSRIGVPWLFDTPSISFIRKLRTNLPRWEGYVAKAEQAYPMGRTASGESPLWQKVKW
jgi:hypothetical protein